MDDLILDRRRLLWRTRGQYWDYLFLLRPEEPSLPGWLQVFEHVFSEDRAPSEGIFYAKSTMRIRRDGRPYYFVAAALMDPTRCDFVGRRIQHFFIYVLKNGEDARQFHGKWAERLLEALDDGLTSIFHEKRGDEGPETFSVRLLRKLLLQIPERLPLGHDPLPIKWSLLPELSDWEVPPEDEKKKGALADGDGPESLVDTRIGSTGAASLSRGLQSQGPADAATRSRTARALSAIVRVPWLDPEVALEVVNDSLSERIGKTDLIRLLEKQIVRLRST